MRKKKKYYIIFEYYASALLMDLCIRSLRAGLCIRKGKLNTSLHSLPFYLSSCTVSYGIKLRQPKFVSCRLEKISLIQLWIFSLSQTRVHRSCAFVHTVHMWAYALEWIRSIRMYLPLSQIRVHRSCAFVHTVHMWAYALDKVSLIQLYALSLSISRYAWYRKGPGFWATVNLNNTGRLKSYFQHNFYTFKTI